jgi:putative glutamine amidotransferase
MQEIASYFNKNNLIKLKDNFHMNEKDKYVHEIEISDNSYLFKLLNKKIIKVNSKHNYCVTNDNHYTIEATYNNVIEAIKVKDRNYILGLQFHPELLYNDDENAKLIFKDFFNKCTNNYLRI